MAGGYTKRGWQVARVLFAFTFISVAANIAMSLVLGGDAVSGHVKDGHYFVNNHGRFTEVTQAEWIISYYIVILFVVNVLALIPLKIWLWWTENWTEPTSENLR